MEKTSKELKATISSAYGYGWKTLKEKFIFLFIVSLIMGFVGLPMAAMQGDEKMSYLHAILFVFGIAYSFFVLNPVKYGVKWVYLKAVRRQESELKEMFDGFKNYLNVMLAALVSGAIVGIGFAFLIIPGIVFACRLAFVPYLVMDKKLDPVKAIEESWRLTKGYGWKLFVMGLLSILIFITGFVVLIFGVIISVMWIRTAFAAMYEAVLIEKGETDLPEIK